MTKELIEDFRKIVKPFVQKRLFQTNYEGMGETDKEEFGQDFDEILDLAIKAISEQRWIPVSERLPENKTYVLVTIGIPGRQPHARSGWYQDGFFHNDNGDCWRATDIEVKAWMLLPEPYKESEEGQA